jgi:hypothetical protein
MRQLVTKHKSVLNQSTDDHEDGGHVFKNSSNPASPDSLRSRNRIKKMLNARQRDLNLCVIIAYSGGG